jgi:hypothetical protein
MFSSCFAVVLVLCHLRLATWWNASVTYVKASPTSAAAAARKSYQRIQTRDKQLDNKPFNAVWPSGISDGDVEHLVEQVMQDSSIEIPLLPDAIERQIYRSTIKLCWNAVYHFLGDIQGKQLFGHEFRLTRWKARDLMTTQKGIAQQYQAYQNTDTVDEIVLEMVARRLLDNKAINQRFLPDVLERKLYVNCLKLVFRLLGMMANSVRIVVCGHEIRLHLSKATASAILTPAVQRVASSLTHIDKFRLHEFALQAGIHDHELAGTFPNVTAPLPQRHGWMERMVDRRQRALLTHVHAALFGLILGILDDLLANTSIDLLSDRITFDIVPATDATTIKAVAKRRQTSVLRRFWTGLGVGLAAVMALFRAT